jgi:hypothetical protein
MLKIECSKEFSLPRRVVRRNPDITRELIASLFWIEEDAGSRRIWQLSNDDVTI